MTHGMTGKHWPHEIPAILSRYSRQITLAQISAVTLHAGFSGAQVWKIGAADNAWALRRWPVGALPAARLRGLHALLAHLRQAGLACVAVPVADDMGESLSFDGTHEWQLEPWLPGRADFQRDPNPARLSATMITLAEWHRAVTKFIPTAECRTWFASHPAAPSPAASERLRTWQREASSVVSTSKIGIPKLPVGELREIGSELADRVVQLGPRIMDELVPIQHVLLPLQPCLRDIWHDHVLFVDDAVTGLIDPSACRSENVATDLARLLGSLVEDDAGAWDAALATYRGIRPLSLAEESLAVLLDRSAVVLSTLTWLRWLFVEERNFPDRAAVLERLRYLQRRLNHLAGHATTTRTRFLT